MWIHWSLDRSEMVRSVEVDRSDSRDGPWSPIEAETRNGEDEVIAIDHSASGNRTYYYRLTATLLDGSTTTSLGFPGVASEVLAFALNLGSENPSRSPLEIQ